MAHQPIIRPKVKIIDNKEKQRRLEYVLKKAHNCYVRVGIVEPEDKYPGKPQGPTVGQVAAWMEFGTHTREGVAQMGGRAKKKDDQHWGIETVPARSFLREPVDRGIAVIERVKNQQLTRIIMGEASIEEALQAIGAKIQMLMQNAISRGIGPELADSTLLRKRAKRQPDTPLLATRFMFEHIGTSVVLNP